MPEKKQQDQDSTPDVQPQDAQQQPEQAMPVTPEKPKKLDETIPGGRYKTPDGRYVNANGEELK